jgi:Ca2+-binding RTX toxin-like protein
MKGNDTLNGGAGNDRIFGEGGDDTYNGGIGDDFLYDASADNSRVVSNDTYLWARGDGQDTVYDYDSAGNNLDVLQFGTGINQTNLWLKRVGNNLEIDLLGTTEKVTIQNWYTSTTGSATNAANQIERIQTDDGFTMYNTDVEQLVQAMAAFAPPSAATTSWTSGATQNGQTLLTVTH